jgi:hypothetical protein
MFFSTYDSHMTLVYKDISYESQLSISCGISMARCTLIGYVEPNPKMRRNTLAPEGFEPLTKDSATLNPLYPST